MSRKQYVLTVALSLIAGMAGGVLASQLLMGTPLFPWKTPLEVETIRAEKFVVVDENGKMRAEFGMGDSGALFVLFDKNQRVIWQAP